MADRGRLDFDAVAEIYLGPRDESVIAPAMPDTPARRLRDALEPIAIQAWWARGVHDRLAPLGFDFFEAYVWGRAAALGEPSASVVVSAFGVFEPQFLTAIYERARLVAAREQVLAARVDGASASLASILGDDPAVARLGDALLAAVEAIDGAARPLFSGLRELPVPSDPHGRLFRGAELVREHRGDGHLAACVAAGLDVVSMNVLTELWTGYAPGEYSLSRGFSEEVVADSMTDLGTRGWVDGDQLTDIGMSARGAIEEATDLTQQQLVSRLGDGLDELIASAEELSARIADARAVPPDPRKLAAG
jgi:hypothetical protein